MAGIESIVVAALLSTVGVGPVAGGFTLDESAECAAAYAFTLNVMQGQESIPQPVRMAMRDGITIWEYELAAAEPGTAEETLQAAAQRALAVVRAGMPHGDGAEVPAQRGVYLQSLTDACALKVKTAYGDTVHPVIPFLRQADGAPAEAGPTTVAATEADRGLR